VGERLIQFMKKTIHYTGHRWSTAELRVLMQGWAAKASVSEIADQLHVSEFAVLKMVNKLRKNGIPLERRTKGNFAGRLWKLWTQGEVEYLVRRRAEKATTEEIAVELGRTVNGVFGMISKLRRENVPIAMRGCGVRRLWNADDLKGVALQAPEILMIESSHPAAIEAA
jgi:biotin operon repressor